MIIRQALLALMWASCAYSDIPQAPLSQNPPIQINVNNNYNGSSTASASGEASNSSNVQAQANVRAQAKVKSNKYCCRVSRIINQGRERFESLQSSTWWAYLNERRGTVALCGLCLACLGTFNKIHNATFQLLNNRDCWSLWRSDLSNIELFSRPDAQLLKELVAEMQLRYVDRQDVESSQRRVSPGFFKSLQEEMDLLKRYQWWHAVLSTFYISGFFNFNTAILEEVSSRLERLEFLRRKFFQLVVNIEVKKYTGNWQGV